MYRIGIMKIDNVPHFVSEWSEYLFVNSDMKAGHFLSIIY